MYLLVWFDEIGLSTNGSVYSGTVFFLSLGPKQPLVQGTAEFLVRGITVLRQKQGASDKPYLLGASSQAFLQAGVRFSQVPHSFSAAHRVFAFGIPA